MEGKMNIHVAMASDDSYAHHLAVAICSILKNLARERFLHVYLLHEGISDTTKDKIENLKNVRNFEIKYIRIDCASFDAFKVEAGNYISRLTYARFQLPELLADLEKCLYLDCDIIVRHDLGELWDIQLPENALIGAVEEPFARHRNIPLNIPDEFSYFNAGVLMLDLQGLRKIQLEKVAYDYLAKSGSLLYGDQDVLNAIFHPSWHALPLQWNVHTHVYLLRDTNKYYRYSKSEIETVFIDPALVHFSHELKPDSLVSENPYRQEYWQYLQPTAWKNMLPKDICPKNISLRLYWLIKSMARKVPILFYGMRAMKRFVASFLLLGS
jgi:lipopolysaccharide biosynthesis glycosyltransferase